MWESMSNFCSSPQTTGYRVFVKRKVCSQKKHSPEYVSSNPCELFVSCYLNLFSYVFHELYSATMTTSSVSEPCTKQFVPIYVTRLSSVYMYSSVSEFVNGDGLYETLKVYLTLACFEPYRKQRPQRKSVWWTLNILFFTKSKEKAWT